MKKNGSFLRSRLSFLILSALLLSGCTGGPAAESTAENDTSAVISEQTQPPLTVTEPGGETAFLVVRQDSASQSVVTASMALMRELKKYSDGFEITTDWEKNPKKAEYEILIGKTTREGKDGLPVLDAESLGDDGYIIKVEGTKIIISGGGDTGTVAAIEEFAKMLSELDGTQGLKLPADLCIIRSGNLICSALTVNGKRFEPSDVIFQAGNKDAEAAAAAVKAFLFGKTGTVFSGASPVKTAVYLDAAPAEATSIGISVKDGSIHISGNSGTGFFRGVRDWLEHCRTSGELRLDDGYMYEVEYGEFVTYEDFGAKGDGKTDDIGAIIAAHKAAGEKGLPVLGREAAEYYIGGGNIAAEIRTDTDWSIAKFTIDDRNVQTVSKEVFLVPANYGWTAVPGISKLNAGQTGIDYKPGYRMFVKAVNADEKQYIRYGANQNSGAAKQDYFIIDADGNVDPSTPVLWDFSKLTELTAKRIEEDKLTIKGGIITTVANAGHESAYYYRGIRIYRSNVIVDGLKHYVTGEGSDGQPYYGILIIYGTVGVEARNVTFTGHKTYKKIGSAGTSVSMGTYDITVTNSSGFRAINCNQTNDINNSTYWGVFASNYSKNIYFDGCSFSRFDAHQGVCNVTLKNCSLGHQGINLIGHGTALIENCMVYSTSFINLRNDYGSTWNGDLIIRNCSYFPKNGAKADAVIIGGSNPGSHWFGYDCHLPRNIIIEGLYIKDSNSSSAESPFLFSNMNSNYNSASYKAQYPMIMPESITVSGLETASGKKLTVSSNKFMFEGVAINYTDGN